MPTREATWVDDSAEVVASCPPSRDIGALLAWAAEAGDRIPLPGGGRTLERWRLLAGAGARDLTAARVLEPHVDALAILDEAGLRPTTSSGATTYGVYAAEGPGARLEATHAPDGRWELTGRKPWCSLGGQVRHALVTAWVDDERRGLFRVDLGHPGVTVADDGSWSPTGLVEVVTVTTEYDAVPAEPVGGPGWYLQRDGFAWGGIGVAAVWYGGAVGLARRLLAQTRSREPDQVALMHLGAVDALLSAAQATLTASAAAVDAGEARGPAGALLAARVRQVVADTVDEVSLRVGHALGPGPLAHEPEHARRVADLALYVRQHHAERDQAALGRMVLQEPGW